MTTDAPCTRIPLDDDGYLVLIETSSDRLVLDLVQPDREARRIELDEKSEGALRAALYLRHKRPRRRT